LYVRIDEATLEMTGSETRLERVPIVANLRHDQLDAVVTEESLANPSRAGYPLAEELAFAYRLAIVLKQRRERTRGRPETFHRPDFTFRLDNTQGCEPCGEETVSITTRRRGAPLDLIVAEAMILANSTWGRWLDELGVPAIYRSQASLAPGVKVRMGTKAQTHAGLGVEAYCWASSPLRRYVDLVNQWQIIAATRHGRMAPLAAAFKPKDATLYSIVSSFDAAYAAYGDFQNTIERFWTLRWLEQNQVRELDAAVLKEGVVRADAVPLVMRALGANGLPRGARVRVRITGHDLLTLDVHASVAARLDDAATTSDDAAVDDEEVDAVEGANAIVLAIDVDDSSAAPEPPTTQSAES
jgi:exoribonuclease-2